MNKELKNIETINHFVSLVECDKFIVTGSHVLHLNGLVDKVGDLDVVLVGATEESIEMLRRLEKDGKYAIIESNKDYPNQATIIRIEYLGLKIDFFLDTVGEAQTQIKLDKFYIATVSSIIAAKKSYGRLKDWIQLRKMAKGIHDETLFQKYLDTSVN